MVDAAIIPTQTYTSNSVPAPPHQDISVPHWKLKRKEITVFYGYITFTVCLLFILILPAWNRISNYLYYKFLQINRMLRMDLQKQLIRVNPMSAQMIIFWSIILSVLSIAQTNWDIRFIASRLGRVPVYCLPTVLFLTLRPSPLPDVLYLSLLPIHKWLSRLVVLQSLLHTIAYLYITYKNGTLNKLSRIDNINGAVAMCAFAIIVLTSLPQIRRKIYNLFFICHYVCTWVAAITLYFHVRPGIPYLTALNVLILVYQILHKFRMSRLSVITTVKISDNMIIANLPNNSLAYLNNMPGCHLRLIDYDDSHSMVWNYLRFIFVPIQHPYTLATLGVDHSQKLLIRVGKYKFKNNHKYLITGSYLPHLSFIHKIKRTNASFWNKFSFRNPPNESLFQNSSLMSAMMKGNNNHSLLVNTQVKKCLIVVGGSAISFALPILRVLNYNGAMVKIIWVIRDHEDLKALDYFKKYLINDDCIDIFITGSYTRSEQANFKEALSELHQRKRELELQQETAILNGGYSYYNTKASDTEPDDSSIVSSSPDSANMKHEQHEAHVEPYEIDFNNVKFTDNTETTPLNKQVFKVQSYGTSLTNEHDHPLLKPKHRKSCIELRNHHNASSSYNTETIDIELKGSGAYDNRTSFAQLDTSQSPAAGVQYASTNSRSNSTSHFPSNNDISIRKELAKNMKTVLSTLNTGTTNSTIRPKQTERSPKAGKYIPPISDPNEYTGAANDTINSTITRVSSAVYDDLEDYWVLKNSFSQIEFGRPKLGIQYYSWCIGSSCIGPLVSLQSGQSICYNIREDPSSPFNELYTNDTFIANQNARFKERNGKPDDTTWVIGAGPSGLVDNVRLWANDCGFSYHEESFIV
jgi:hypothetical protein